MRDPSLHILQHALGLDDNGHGKVYRNHYVAQEGSNDYGLCMEHVTAGRMTRTGPSDMYGGKESYCFHVTEVGREYVREHSPKPRPKTRAQKRYQAWLDSDACVPFGEWLRNKHYRYYERVQS